MASTPHSLGIVRSDDKEPVAWKNGVGSTREIARRLLGVRGPHYVWRLSVSDITGDTGLTTFAGVDRSTTVIEGSGATLVSGGEERSLTPFVPVGFDAETEAHVRLTDGPVRVFNVMTARSRMSAQVRVVDLSTDRGLSIAGTTLVVLLSGEASVSAADGSTGTLAPLDTLVARPRVRIVSGTGSAAVIRMENYRAWRAFSW